MRIPGWFPAWFACRVVLVSRLKWLTLPFPYVAAGPAKEEEKRIKLFFECGVILPLSDIAKRNREAEADLATINLALGPPAKYKSTGTRKKNTSELTAHSSEETKKMTREPSESGLFYTLSPSSSRAKVEQQGRTNIHAARGM